MKRKNTIWALFAAALMVGALACGDDGDTGGNGSNGSNGSNGGTDAGNGGNGGSDTGNGGNGGTDAGTPDADAGGTPDADAGGTPDADAGGTPDADAGGTPDADAGPITDALEGEACTASTDATSTALAQDNCAAGLSCVPWDEYLIAFLTTPPPEITPGSIQSCVQLCEEDTECGTGRFCSRSQLLGTALGNVGMCVDEIGGIDEACGESKLSTRLIRNQDGQLIDRLKDDPSVMIGCEEGLSCQHAILNSHPDEGFCQEICATNADCTNDDNDTCFEGLFNGGEGYCGKEDPRHGRYCGEIDPGDKILRLATGCGFEDVACLTLNGQETPDGNIGVCFELCSQADNQCDKTVDGDLGQGECFVDENNANNGICISNCGLELGSAINLAGTPELCPTGQFCSAWNVPVAQNFTVNGVPTCQDYLEPRIARTEFDDSGNTTTLGGDCGGGGFDAFRCENGHTCLDSGQANPAAICVPRCDLRQAGADAACETVVGAVGSVCGETTTSTIVGICSTP
jgi:hypothetical protein